MREDRDLSRQHRLAKRRKERIVEDEPVDHHVRIQNELHDWRERLYEPVTASRR
jgi:hypothetical protein